MIDVKYILNIAKNDIKKQIDKIEKELVSGATLLVAGKEINVTIKDVISKDFIINEFEKRGFNVEFRGSPNFQTQSSDYWFVFSIKKDLLNKD